MFQISAFETARALVVADAMLDRYRHGDVGRISPEYSNSAREPGAPEEKRPWRHTKPMDSRLRGNDGNISDVVFVFNDFRYLSSCEAPVPVVRIGNEEQRLGGRTNLARVGVHVTLPGVVAGDDAVGGEVRALDFADSYSTTDMTKWTQASPQFDEPTANA